MRKKYIEIHEKYADVFKSNIINNTCKHSAAIRRFLRRYSRLLKYKNFILAKYLIFRIDNSNIWRKSVCYKSYTTQI